MSDETLRALERAAHESPDDAPAADRLERARDRAGCPEPAPLRRTLHAALAQALDEAALVREPYATIVAPCCGLPPFWGDARLVPDRVLTFERMAQCRTSRASFSGRINPLATPACGHVFLRLRFLDDLPPAPFSRRPVEDTDGPPFAGLLHVAVARIIRRSLTVARLSLPLPVLAAEVHAGGIDLIPETREGPRPMRRLRAGTISEPLIAVQPMGRRLAPDFYRAALPPTAPESPSP